MNKRYWISSISVLSLSAIAHGLMFAAIYNADLLFLKDSETPKVVNVVLRTSPNVAAVEEPYIAVIESGHDGSVSLADKVAEAFKLPKDVAAMPIQMPEVVVPDISIPKQTFVQNPNRPSLIQSEFLYRSNKDEKRDALAEDVVDQFRSKQYRLSGYMRSGLSALSDYGTKEKEEPQEFIPRPDYKENLFESRQKKELSGIEKGELSPMLIAQNHIHKHLDRPKNDWPNELFHGVVGFYIDHYGNVRELKFKKRSGNVELDNAIELAIRRASPLPVPDDEIQLRRFIQQAKRFDYNETYLY